MSQELAALFAKRFIQRRDIKAVQFKDGAWSPDRELRNLNGYAPLGFKMPHLLDHIAGKRTYGHYLLDQNDLCRVFVFDIDLKPMTWEDREKTKIKWSGNWVELPELSGEPMTEADIADKIVVHEGISPRDLWHDRTAQKARGWYKYQMRMLAQKFIKVIVEELNIGCATAYSGSKGVHVYGFCGEMPAKEAREGAALVLDILDEFEPERGNNFFTHRNDDPIQGFQNFSIEVFPKQDSLKDKDLGNLVRLPLGRNLKSADPTFFLDLGTPLSVLAPHGNPVQLLETGNPYL